MSALAEWFPRRTDLPIARLGGVIRLVDPAIRGVGPWVRAVTPVGWLALLGGAAALWTGVRQGWQEFAVIGVFALVTWFAAIAWTLGRRGYAASIDLDRVRVTAGDTAAGAVAVRNTSRRTLLPIRMELPVGSGSVAFRLPPMGTDAAHTERFSLATTRRGVVELGPVRSVKSDPLGYLRRTQNWTESTELFVHPPTVLIHAGASGFLKDIEGVTTRDLSSSDVAFHALREYVPGDDLRSIHWRTTARVGRLMVRQFEETRRSHLLLLLSLRPADYAEDTEFELAISCLASMALQAIREERRVDIVTHEGSIRYPSARGLLDQLCRVQLRVRSGSLRDLAAAGIRAYPTASIAAVVTGSEATTLDLRGAHTALPPQLAAFAVRCAPAEQARRREVRDLIVIDVPSLTDLPRAVRGIR